MLLPGMEREIFQVNEKRTESSGKAIIKNLADFTQSGKRWRIAGAGERIRQEQIFM